MAHSKVSMLEQMGQQGKEIVGLLVKEDVTIKPEQLGFEDGCKDLRADFIRPAFHWLNDVYENEYSAIVKFKKQQPESIWKRYKTWGGFEECREVKLLAEKLNALRTRVLARSRPDFYKKGKRTKLLKAKEKAGVPAAKGAS